jgi:hypothetical protein
MKKVVLAGLLIAALGFSAAPAFAQAAQSTQPAAKGGTTLGTVTLKNKVMADGKPLAAGTYQVRLTDENPKPGVGQSTEGERYVEFLKAGKVVGREVATVVSNADVKTIAKGPHPATNGSRVDMLKGNDYVRVWINRGGNNYIIHLPPAA